MVKIWEGLNKTYKLVKGLQKKKNHHHVLGDLDQKVQEQAREGEDHNCI